MKEQNRYQIEVKKLQAELALAKAKAAYYEYLTVDCDLYEKSAEFIVGDLKIPNGMFEKETDGCKVHIAKIKAAEAKFYAFA